MSSRRPGRQDYEDDRNLILDYVEWEQQISHSSTGSILALRRGPALAIAAYLILALSGLLQRL